MGINSEKKNNNRADDYLCPAMRTVVGLKKVIFYAMHGYYETEKQTGNQFEITLKCHFVKKENQFA